MFPRACGSVPTNQKVGILKVGTIQDKACNVFELSALVNVSNSFITEESKQALTL